MASKEFLAEFLKPHLHHRIREEVTRFADVVQKRIDQPEEFIALFGKLLESNKFLEEAKPYCFALLFHEAAFFPLDMGYEAWLGRVLDEIARTGAGKLVQNNLLEQESEITAGRLVAQLFAVVDTEDDAAVFELFQKVQESGLAPNRCCILDYIYDAAQENNPQSPFSITLRHLDFLCDLSWAEQCRRREKSVPEATLEAIANYRVPF